MALTRSAPARLRPVRPAAPAGAVDDDDHKHDHDDDHDDDDRETGRALNEPRGGRRAAPRRFVSSSWRPPLAVSPARLVAPVPTASVMSTTPDTSFWASVAAWSVAASVWSTVVCTAPMAGWATGATMARPFCTASLPSVRASPAVSFIIW